MAPGLVPPQGLMAAYLTSRYSSMPSGPPSRPKPESLFEKKKKKEKRIKKNRSIIIEREQNKK